MKKLLKSLPLLVATCVLGTLAGCDLYFGDHNDGGGDSWNYCGSDGYYQCQGNDCTWVSATCPPDSTGSGGSGNGSGYECTSNTDCAAGCYCTTNNVCEEGGFCTTDADCGSGYHCDTSRSSCEPNTTTTCSSDADCTGTGQFCDPTSGACQQGSCGGTITCNTAAPVCASGSVPTIYNGCYTGDCLAVASCDVAPTCAAINDETDCLNRTNDCTAVYTGIDCTTADGTACTSGDTGCTCASFQFDHCSDKAVQ
jgi:hypothetical protein